MKTFITGCSGLVGSALVEYLFSKGHSIQCLKRQDDSDAHHLWATSELAESTQDGAATFIHLAGENVANERWSAKKKQRILDSRVQGTKALVDYISSLKVKPQQFLCASAVGFYGSRGNEILDEESPAGRGFLADVCQQWENECQRLSAMGVRVVNLRFGMVLSPRAGALHKMIPPVKAWVGGTIGSGRQYVSWISIRDLVAIVHFLINNTQITGPVNVVSPVPVTNLRFTESLGKTLNRPTPFRVPSPVAKLIFGQMADEMLLSSTRVIPKRLLDSGYEFIDQSLDEALRFCVT